MPVMISFPCCDHHVGLPEPPGQIYGGLVAFIQAALSIRSRPYRWEWIGVYHQERSYWSAYISDAYSICQSR